MNRLFAEPLSNQHLTSESAFSAVSTPPPTKVRPSKIHRSATAGEAYSLFTPLHYEENYAYPVLVWLHSGGGDERQLSRIMPLVSLRNYIGLAVRGPSEGQNRGYGWAQTAEAIDAARQRIAESIDKVRQKLNIHPQRIYLVGYESGGTMAYRIALQDPERYAAAVSLSGPFPEGGSPLARLTHIRKFPLLMAHCRDSQNHPIDRVCQELKLLHAAGLAVTLRQYPCGDELTTQMLHDVDVWLMEQVTGAASVAEQPDPAEQSSDWN